jgi:HlyD family secretion protein
MDKKQWYRYRYLWLALVTTLGLGGIGTWKHFIVKADKTTYLFSSVDRGDIVSQVVAQGSISPVVSVDVGSQVSGTIAELYADFNTVVKKGQLLARLDPQLYQADVDQQEANVRTAEANLGDDEAAIASARADVEKAKVDTLYKKHSYSRQKELFDQSLMSQDDMDTAQAALDAAIATQKAAEEEIESTTARYKEDQARLAQARATLATSKLNLDHSVITSPISGTVVNRNVDRGQTVAASFSAPVLFTIGQDLTKMLVNTNIDEASVGSLKVGMQATFLVDAYPGQPFTGTISQIRLNSTTVNNVVTYNAVISVDNPDLLLEPGMTANVKIQIAEADSVLRIVNSALRFKPNLTDGQFAEVFGKIGEEKFWNQNKDLIKPQAPPTPMPGAGAGSQPRIVTKAAKNPYTAGSQVPLWIVGPDGKSLVPVVVKLGLTDGMTTQIGEGNLKQGDRIVIGLEFDPNRPAPNPSRMPGFGGTPMIRR